jgi:hypothetical protein
MRSVLFFMTFTTACCASSLFGTWKMDAGRSKTMGSVPPRGFTVRIEPHAKGEVFTLDRVEVDGRATSSSSILYLDSTPRELQDFDCVGVQSSRRLDSRTIENRRNCASSDCIWFVRHSTDKARELMIDITEKHRSGPNLDWRLVLEKQ